MLNVDKVNITGLDVTTEAAGAFVRDVFWQARVAYTLQKAIEVTDPTSINYKDQLPYTPVHSGSGFLQAQYKKWSLGYSALFSGSRYALGGNNAANSVAGWLVQDVSLSRNIQLKNCKLNIKAELNNLANERYDVVRYFPMQGRSYKINISIINF